MLRGSHKMQRASLMQKDNQVIVILRVMIRLPCCSRLMRCHPRHSGWDVQRSNLR
jgi:hypothetical protein